MEKRFIVTIGREFGTGGRQIATELAEMLGVQLYDRQLLDTIKERYNMTQEEIDQVKAVKPSWWYESVSADMYKDEEFLVRSLAHKEARENFTKTFSGKTRYDARNYDLVLNVTDLEPKEVARFIADCVQRKIAN